MSKLGKDDLILAFIMGVLTLTLLCALKGNKFAEEVFQSTWVALPTYLGTKKLN